jgi:thioredoxin reductase
MLHDVVIAGGGPAGLAAALTLGRARRRVLLCDAGPRRNAAAVHVHNFVTRDGITPDDFRRIAREQLAAYPHVQVRDAAVASIEGAAGDFSAVLSDGTSLHARRVLLAVGMVDELPAVDGMREYWGTSVFQCPYCHAWEVQDGRFAYLARTAETLEFAILLRGWTSSVTLLTGSAFGVPDDFRPRLAAAGVTIDERPIARLTGAGGQLQGITLTDGSSLPCDALFVHPHQRPPQIATALGLALDDKGFVRLSDSGETSVPGIYAAGDLVSPLQAAILAAGAGMRGAALLNARLTEALAVEGALDSADRVSPAAPTGS